MKVNLAIGAPSLTGKGAHEVDAVIASMQFPCSLVVTNHMPRQAVFPESGVELASSFASSGRSQRVEFASEATLRRLLRTASQVAELNGYSLALVVSDTDPLDEELTAQVIAENPELEGDIKEGGGVDAAATLADTGEGSTNAAEANADANTNSDDDGSAAGSGTETGGKPADAPTPAAGKKGGGTSSTRKTSTRKK